MNDVEFTRALERGEIANENFRHTAHLHVAWVYLSESSSVEGAAAKMRATLRKFAASAGKPEKYHETITLFWVRLLAHARAIAPKESVENVVKANPQLLEKDFPFAYYSRERLLSENARIKWMEPDLKPLSADAIAPCSSRPPCNAQNRALSR